MLASFAKAYVTCLLLGVSFLFLSNIMKQAIVFGKQCWPVFPRLMSLVDCSLPCFYAHLVIIKLRNSAP